MKKDINKKSISGLVALVLAALLLINTIAIAEHTAWDCPECGRTGNTGNFCGGCGHASPYIEGQKTESAQEKKSTTEFKTVGNIVTFGRYEQDNKTENGPEEIEWIVLDYDERNHKSLLLSRYGLDSKPYNEKYKATTWNECTLRTWLNDSFLNVAFTVEEWNAIMLTDVDNSSSQGYDGWSTSGGNNTKDKMFLLSYAEANKYLGVTYENKGNTKSRVAPTAYAISRGAYISKKIITVGTYAGWWWLRSPGNYQNYAAIVSSFGSRAYDYVSRVDGCVRPALWINLKSEIF